MIGPSRWVLRRLTNGAAPRIEIELKSNYRYINQSYSCTLNVFVHHHLATHQLWFVFDDFPVANAF